MEAAGGDLSARETAGTKLPTIGHLTSLFFDEWLITVDHAAPTRSQMFANDWSAAEGIIGAWEAADGNDDRWLVSALNIVAANRSQVRRVDGASTH